MVIPGTVDPRLRFVSGHFMNPSVAVQRSTPNSKDISINISMVKLNSKSNILYFKVVLKIDLLHKFTVTDVGVSLSSSYRSERSYLSKLVTGAIVGYCPLHSSSPVAAQRVVELRVNKNKDTRPEQI